MANPIDLIITKEALKVVDDAIAKVNLLDKTMQEAAQHFIDNGKKMSSATPSGVAGNAENNAAVTAQLKAQSDTIAKLSKELDILNTKLVKLNETRTNGKKLTADQIVQNQAERKAAIETAKANSELIGSYEKLNIKHQQAVRNAQNIGVTYGTTSKQFIKASADANKLDEQLKSLDSTLGKNQRNVGNYKTGFNALGNSISQLSREMPAFANSAQTGFMAISNNIPAFQDAIMQMRAGGMSWGQIIKEMGASLFGLTGMISLATTLLVVLGPKLIDWITNTDDQKEATDRLTASLKKQNEQLRMYNETIEHQKILAVENAKQRGASIKELQSIERTAAEDQLKNFENNRNNRKKDFDDFVKTEARKRMAYFASPVGFMDRVRAMEKVVRAESSLQKNALIEAEKAVKAQGFVLSELIERQQTEIIESSKKNNEKFNSEVLQVAEKFAKKELEALAETEHEKYRLLVQTSFQELDLAIKTDQEKIKQMEVSEDEKKLLLLQNAKDAITARRAISDAMIAEEKKLFAKESAELKDLTKGTTIEGLSIKDVDKSGTDALKALENQQKAIEKTRKSMEELNKSTDDWLQSFSSEFLQNSGFGNLETFFDGTFNKLLAGAETVEERFAVTFNAIAESAQEAFNFISNASQKNFDSEKERLQSQYDMALSYAGDNKVAQEKLAEDLEAKKKDIANREAKAKQKQAMFNIAIDTAQAIMGLWGNPGFPQAIPLAITVGALGLAQIAMVASQEIPQYWMGGTHDGGLMMVNDGSGSNYKETIVTPDGKIMKPQGRNVIMDAPVGTEIFTHDQWQQQLNNMLQGNNINWHNHQQTHGITKDDLEDVFVRTLGSQAQHYSNFDANGASSYIVKRGNITRMNTNRSNGKGIKFT